MVQATRIGGGRRTARTGAPDFCEVRATSGTDYLGGKSARAGERRPANSRLADRKAGEGRTPTGCYAGALTKRNDHTKGQKFPPRKGVSQGNRRTIQSEARIEKAREQRARYTIRLFFQIGENYSLSQRGNPRFLNNILLLYGCYHRERIEAISTWRRWAPSVRRQAKRRKHDGGRGRNVFRACAG
jgi:hypothetical protein